MRFRAILVHPEDYRNVGAVVRAGAFFGVEEVVVVSAEPLSAEESTTIRVASAGMVADVKFRRCEGIAEAADGCKLLLATTSRERKSLALHSVEQAFEKAAEEKPAEVGVLFGRESTGLHNAELALCVAGIRINGLEGRSLNLGQAASVIFYEAANYAANNVDAAVDKRVERASFREIEAFASRTAGEGTGPRVHYDDLVRLLVRAGASRNDLALLQNLGRRNSKA